VLSFEGTRLFRGVSAEDDRLCTGGGGQPVGVCGARGWGPKGGALLVRCSWAGGETGFTKENQWLWMAAKSWVGRWFICLSVYLLRIPWNKECLSPYPMIVPVFLIGLSGNASCGHAVNGKVMFENTEWNGWGALVSDKPGLQTPGLELFNWVYLHVFPTGIGGDICLLSTVKHISAGVPHLSSNQWHADNRSRSVFRQTQDASQHAVATLQVLGFAHPKTISKVRMGSSLMGCYTKNNNL